MGYTVTSLAGHIKEPRTDAFEVAFHAHSEAVIVNKEITSLVFQIP